MPQFCLSIIVCLLIFLVSLVSVVSDCGTSWTASLQFGEIAPDKQL